MFMKVQKSTVSSEYLMSNVHGRSLLKRFVSDPNIAQGYKLLCQVENLQL